MDASVINEVLIHYSFS